MSVWPPPSGASGVGQRGLLADHRAFDREFILGVLVVALAMGALASLSAAMLIAVVWVDTWLLANPHLVATYTRIVKGKGAVWRHRFLIFALPLCVLLGVTVTALAYDIAGLFTLYFVAQTYHVARQSFGIARAYRRVGGGPAPPDRLTQALIYLVPGWGLLARCAQAPNAFLGYPIQWPAIPAVWADAVGVAALLCGLAWLWRFSRHWLAGQADVCHDGFVASHVVVAWVAYVAVTDITLGWLVLNSWHNLQYLLFVWAQNVRRDQPGARGAVRQSGADALRTHLARYAALCLLTGAAVFLVADWLGAQALWLGLPTVLMAHFTLNFHHYLVDAVIWRRRHPTLQSTT